MEVNRECNRNKSNFGPTCTKYTLFLVNVVFIINSLLVISSAVSAIAVFTSYNDMMNFGLNTVVVWLAAGIVLFPVSLFGIFTAFKGYTALANIYAFLMLVVLILQIVASLFSFFLINETARMVSMQLKTMMSEYSNEYRLEVDWIQSNFQCCGIVGPNDWDDFDKFSTPRSDYDSYNHNGLMPVSCCEKDSNYVSLKCLHYHSSGCFGRIHQIVSASVTLAGIFGVIFSALQFLGIVMGLYYARVIRRKKTQRDMQIWNTDQPPDYSSLQW